MSVLDYQALKEKLIARAGELAQSGTSGDQVAYIMKALEILENAQAESKLVESLEKIAQLEDLLNQTTDQVASFKEGLSAFGKLGSPAVRLFGMGCWDYWDAYVPDTVPTGNNASKWNYNNLANIKNTIKNAGPVLQFGLRNKFYFSLHHYSWNNNPAWAWSLYLLKNNSDVNKTVSLWVYLSHYNNNAYGAYVVVNGSVLLSWTNNNINSSTLNFQIPAKSGCLVYIVNRAYYQNNNNSQYFHRLVHHVSFSFPEGVEWDYEAYKQLIED